MILSIAVCAFYSIWMDTKTFDDMMESKEDYDELIWEFHVQLSVSNQRRIMQVLKFNNA